MARAAPNRRHGETKGSARKRAKAAGICQGCGRKKNNSGRLCGSCTAKAARRTEARKDEWQ